MSDDYAHRTLECADPHTGAYPQSAWGMLRTAQVCLELYKLTEDRKYVERGLEVIDELCLFQSLWNKPWRSQKDFGGLVNGNLGSIFDAQLSAEFARCAMEYGALTGEREYFERGTAALAAALALAQSGMSRARAAGSAAIIRSMFGSAYVDLGKKWGLTTTGEPLHRIKITRGAVSIVIDEPAGDHEM